MAGEPFEVFQADVVEQRRRLAGPPRSCRVLIAHTLDRTPRERHASGRFHGGSTRTFRSAYVPPPHAMLTLILVSPFRTVARARSFDWWCLDGTPACTP